MRQTVEARLRDENEMLREQVRQLQAVLLPDIHIPDEFKLTPSEIRVLKHLTSRKVATFESILMALYSDKPDVAPHTNVAQVFVCKMRRKLKPHGIFIRGVWGRGYQLEGWPATGGQA